MIAGLTRLQLEDSWSNEDGLAPKIFRGMTRMQIPDEKDRETIDHEGTRNRVLSTRFRDYRMAVIASGFTGFARVAMCQRHDLDLIQGQGSDVLDGHSLCKLRGTILRCLPMKP
jgi:hypothetical protein